MIRCIRCEENIDKDTIYEHKEKKYCRHCYFKIFNREFEAQMREQSGLSTKKRMDEGYPDYYFKGGIGDI